ncbi:MAG: S8 family serine peptidase, partial [Calditrichaeota bacterium]|nr:S8 family serine peptidase [Calditrichota bacterium]
MVAAKTEDGSLVAGESNYGERIDANGWGRNIVTTGYGNKYPGDGVNEYYTGTFGGTSGATPMVAGVAAILQGINRHYTQSSLTSRDIKQMLRNLGPGGWLYPNFGYRPDLKKLINMLEISTLVEVDQVDGYDDESINENIGRYENDSNWEYYPVPHIFNDVFFAHDLILGAYPEFVPKDNQEIKYHYWNELDDGLILIKNEFDVIPDNLFITAYFNEPFEAVLRANLISAGNNDQEQINFKNPWLIDFNHTAYGLRNRGMNAPFLAYDSPFEISLDSDHKGVFLNQGNPPYWDNPHYSVRAEQEPVIPFHGQNITWYFQGWGGTNVQFQNANQTQTAVVFQSQDAIAMAKYKGHLATDVAVAMATNSQRKIVYDGVKLHMVYEDNNHIYYTYSGDGGAVWTPEIKLSGGYPEHMSPSICLGPEGEICVVWQYGNLIEVTIRRSDGTWTQTNELELFPYEIYDVTPTVDYTGGYYYILWRDQNWGFWTYDLKLISYERSEVSFGEAWTIPETNDASLNPSMISDEQHFLHTAWEEEGKIYYSKISASGDDYDIVFNKECASDGSGYSDHKFPCI